MRSVDVGDSGIDCDTTPVWRKLRIDGTDLVQLTDTPNDVEYFIDRGIDPK